MGKIFKNLEIFEDEKLYNKMWLVLDHQLISV